MEKDDNKPPVAAADLSWQQSANGTRQERGSTARGQRGRDADRNNKQSERVTNKTQSCCSLLKKPQEEEEEEEEEGMLLFLVEEKGRKEKKEERKKRKCCANLPSTRSWLRCRSRAAI